MATLKENISHEKQDVFKKHRFPGCNSQNLKVLYFDPAPYPGHVMLVKCEKPIDDITLQVCLVYDHPNFKYGTLYVSRTTLQTNRQTDKQKDGWMIWLLDSTDRPFRPGAYFMVTMVTVNVY